MVKIRIEFEGEVKEMECKYLFGSGCVSETEAEIDAVSFLYGHISVKNLANLIGSAVPNIVRENARDPITACIALRAIQNCIAEARLELMKARVQQEKER